jgi:hypothetical protein
MDIDINCPICYENISDNNYKTICNHNFHKDCFNNWLVYNQSCPLCRTIIINTTLETNKLYYVKYRTSSNYFTGMLEKIFIINGSLGYKFTNIRQSLWPAPNTLFVFDTIADIIQI